MGKFFTLNFWFDLRPGQISPASQNTLIAFLVILMILMTVAFILKRNKKTLYFRFWEKIFTFSSSNILLGLLIWFLNYENIPFFSARFWFLLWIMEIGVWLYFSIRYALSLPKRKKEIEEEKAYKKYLP